MYLDKIEKHIDAIAKVLIEEASGDPDCDELEIDDYSDLLDDVAMELQERIEGMVG